MLAHGADLPACAALATAQGLTVSLSGPLRRPSGRLRCPWAVAAAALPAGFAAMVALLAARPQSADAVQRIALVGVPALAAIALPQVTRRPLSGFAVLPLLGVAVAGQGQLAGQVATLVLVTLSCVALGTLIVGIGSSSALVAGVAVLAAIDVVLVSAGVVPTAARALLHADAGLPSFSQAVLGTFTLGYGDLLVAAIAGAVAAHHPGAARRVGVLTLVLVLAEGALLSDRGQYPATVPVIAALALDALWRRHRSVARAP
jgi:hypothetical protein